MRFSLLFVFLPFVIMANDQCIPDAYKLLAPTPVEGPFDPATFVPDLVGKDKILTDLSLTKPSLRDAAIRVGLIRQEGDFVQKQDDLLLSRGFSPSEIQLLREHSVLSMDPLEYNHS